LDQTKNSPREKKPSRVEWVVLPQVNRGKVETNYPRTTSHRERCVKTGQKPIAEGEPKKKPSAKPHLGGGKNSSQKGGKGRQSRAGRVTRPETSCFLEKTGVGGGLLPGQGRGKWWCHFRTGGPENRRASSRVRGKTKKLVKTC